MDRRTVGVEEELLLVDPDTREVTPRSHEVLERAAAVADSGDVDRELFRHQLEIRTEPVTELTELRARLLDARRAAEEAAGRVGLVTVASGTSLLTAGSPEITRDDRYLDMLETYRGIARPAGTCGMHVHVRVTTDEEGVAVIDGIAPWLPVLLAISANSPFYRGQDTGYASWRAQLWSRWPSAGPTERFGTVERYREVGRRLIASGAARDPGMLYFDARLSADHPTVEVRVADVCTDPDDAVLVTALVRALVEHTSRAASGSRRAEAVPGPEWRAELLRAAQWRASRYGLTSSLVHPVTGENASARDVLDALVGEVRDELEEHGDLALVEDGTRRVLAAGGATRQRSAYERNDGSLAAVVDDLVARTNPAGRSRA